MNVSGFVDLLDRTGLDPTPLGVCEILWLAQYARPPHAPEPAGPGPGSAARRTPVGTAPTAGGAAAPARGSPAPGGPAPAVPARGPHGPAATAPAGGRPDGPGGYPPGRRVPLYLATGQSGPGRAEPVQVPASPALPGTLGLLRALRPLKRQAPDPAQLVVDQEATVTATAECGGRIMPVLAPRRDRWLSAELVIDTAPAMAMWATLAGELRVLLERLGAFREVRTWQLRTSGGAVLGVSQPRQRVLRDPGELARGSGRQVLLVLTDGGSEAWYSGAMGRVLRGWGRAGSLALIQPLPQQLWSRTALSPVRGRLTSGRGAAPNASLSFRPYARRTRSPADAVPVPVLELGADWLRGWAGFVGSSAGAALDCAVTLTATAVPAPALADPPGRSPDERVRHFAENASPEALRLATYLAATPMSLPVMRHVQRALLPESRPSHLAEVMLGGLLSPSGWPGRPDSPEEWHYEFADGVRDILLGSLGRSDALRVLHAVSERLSANFGRRADSFTAALAAPQGSPGISLAESSRPFAVIAAQVIQRVTGRFPPEPAAPPADPSAPGGQDPARLIRQAEQAAGLLRPGASPADLNRAIGLWQAALDGLAPGDPRRPAVLVRLGGLFLGRYQATGVAENADRAVASLRDALDGPGLPGPDRPAATAQLATALKLRFAATGQLPDLGEAAATLAEAVADTLPGPRRAALLSELAAVHGLRFARTGSAADADAAVTAARAAVTDAEAGHDDAGNDGNGDAGRELARYRGQLGGLLLRRAGLRPSGDARADLDEAIAELRAAAAPAIPGAAELVADDLATALRSRAAVPGQDAGDDLDAAAAVLRGVIRRGRPEDTARPSWLAGLGDTLVAHSGLAGSGDAAEADLREAVACYQEAAAAMHPAGSELARCLADAGMALRLLAARTGSATNLGQAVQALRAALPQTGAASPLRPRLMAELAAALRTRFDQDGRRGDLIEAADLLRSAAELVPTGPAGQAGLRAMLAAELAGVHELAHTRTGAPADLLAAARAYQDAIAADPPGEPAWQLGLGRVLAALGRDAEAIAVLDRLIADQPLMAEAVGLRRRLRS